MTGSAATGAGSALWYLSRATGIVSLLLLTAVVVLGVLVRRGGTPAGLPRFVVSGLHRNVSMLSIALLAVHIGTSVLDPYAPIRVLDTVVPLISDYRPVWLGLGAAALDLLLAIVVTSLLRLRIRPRAWRVVHWASFAAWPVALVHGLGTGTDTRRSWQLVLTAGCVLAVLAAVAWRLRNAPGARPAVRACATALAVGLPVVLVLWMRGGPLAPHWAARAGTPAALLAHPSPASGPDTANGPTGGSTGALPEGAVAVSGTVTEDQTRGGVTLVLAGTLSGEPGTELRIVLRGEPVAGVPGGDASLTSGTVTLHPAGGGQYTGAVTRLHDGEIAATLDGPAGPIQLDSQVSLQGDAFTGTVTIT